MKKSDVQLCPMLPRTDWAAKWIWVPDRLGYSARNSYAFFRRRFRASGDITIDIAADTQFELYLDGTRVARGTAPSNSAYKSFDSYNLHVDGPEHVIAVLVHHIGENCATAMKSRPGLLVEVKAVESVVVSDSTWRVLPGTCYSQDIVQMMSHFGFHEVCDYRKMPEGWHSTDYDDGSWSYAEVVGEVGCKPWTFLIPRDIPHLMTDTVEVQRVVNKGSYQERPINPIPPEMTVADRMAARERIIYDISAVEFPAPLGGHHNEFVVIDFGREVTGHVKLLLDSVRDGQVVDIGYDEVLNERGLPNPRRTYVHFADRFFLREGQRELEVFGARGFRYLLVDVPAGKGGLVLVGARIDERTYPVHDVSDFRCSDTALEQLYRVGLQTVRLCTLDTYVDCPSRERVLWMDSYLEGIFSSYGMGITRPWRRALYLFAQNTSSLEGLDGAIKGFVPTDREPVVQAYMMYYAYSLADYVLHSGDTLTGEILFETAMNQFSVLEKFTTSEGIIGDRWNEWQFVDWSAMDIGGISASVNALYIVMHRKMARLARELGQASLADEIEAKVERLIRSFKRMFWIAEESLFADALRDNAYSQCRSQLTNALAVWAGVIRGDEARDLIRRITDEASLLPVTPGDYRLKPDFRCQTGGIVPIGTPALGTVLALVMFELGMDDEALGYLINSWTHLAVNDAFAEHFAFDTNTSFCHGWSAAPVMLLPRYVLGIRPLTPGWTTVAIDPHCGNLDWAEGMVRTPLGEVRVAWHKTHNGLKVEKHLPAGMTEVKEQVGRDPKNLSVR